MAKRSQKKQLLKNIKTYVYTSRYPLYGCLLVFPLLITYEILVLKLRQTQLIEVRNGADVMLRNLLEYLGVHGMLACSAVVLGALLVFIIFVSIRNKYPLKLHYFGYMIMESAVLALLFGLLMGQIVALFPLSTEQGVTLTTKILLSIGAGIYEELVFRVILLSGMIFLAIRVFKRKPTPSIITATIISSLAFAAFHYFGPGKDSFVLHSFLFRLLAGFVFGVIYVLRGFGVAAYMHTFYDLYLDFYLAADGAPLSV